MNTETRILLVEDEPVIVAAAGRALRPEGFQVDETGSVPEALERLTAQTYDLILCDLMLPQVSGLELVRAAVRDFPDVPVILITGYATLENALESFRAGAFDFIPKPFDIGELLGVVYRAAARHRAPLDAPLPPDDGRLLLGRHSWARRDNDGLWMVGVGATFPHLLGTVHGVEFAPLNTEILQGNWCAKIFSREDHVNKVWSPLSGNVVAVNDRLSETPSLIDSDPFGEGWLVKLLPANLKSELKVLYPGRRS